MPLPSPEALRAFREADDGAPFVLIQLLRYAEGGRKRYLEYAASVQQVLARHGGRLLYGGEAAGAPLAGEAWDGLVLVRYPSRGAYLKMLEDPAFAALAPLRAGAVREALLLPAADWGGR